MRIEAIERKRRGGRSFSYYDIPTPTQNDINHMKKYKEWYQKNDKLSRQLEGLSPKKLCKQVNLRWNPMDDVIEDKPRNMM